MIDVENIGERGNTYENFITDLLKKDGDKDDIQKGKKFRYGIFHIAGGMIDVEKIGERGNTYENFMTDLLKKDGDKDDCRFAIFDYEYKFAPQGAEAQNKSKIFLLCWCPDSAAIKKKMLYSSSFDTLKR